MKSTIPEALDVLLLSNSTNHGEPFLAHAREEISLVVAGRQLVFLPFALEDWDGYSASVQRALPDVDVVGAHHLPYMDDSILDASCVFVGGGNTFRLLATLQRLDLLDPLRERITAGECSYIGSSAGTNIAGPSIRTTNDMPIVETGSLTALSVVPFQLNPHFTDATVPNLAAETRAERIAQFHEHSSTPVLALYEGSWLRVAHGEAVVGGPLDGVLAKVFQPGEEYLLKSKESVLPWWRAVSQDDQPSHLRTLSNRHHRAAGFPRSI